MQPLERTISYAASASSASPDDDLESNHRYLVFELGGELYACPILQVREVIKVRALTPVPYMLPSFTGMLNLRGQMVGVVDLRVRFQIPPAAGKPGIILVVDLGDSLLGVHVDDVRAVANVAPKDVRTEITVETKFAIDFLTGMTNIDERIVSIIDLSRMLSSAELRSIRSSAGDTAGDTARNAAR